MNNFKAKTVATVPNVGTVEKMWNKNKNDYWFQVELYDGDCIECCNLEEAVETLKEYVDV